MKNFLEKHKDDKWLMFLYRLFKSIRDHEVMAIGAQLTYYLILSVFPFLIFLLNVIGHISIVDSSFLDDMLILLPAQTQVLVESIVNEITVESTDKLMSFSIFLSLWSGSLGISAIIRAINKAYNINRRRSYIRQKIVSIIFAIALVILLVVVLLTLVFGELIGNIIFSYIGATNIFYEIWESIRKIIPLLSMIIIFALLYKYSILPKERNGLKLIHTLPGSVFTTVGWIIASRLFSYYVNNFANYSKTYGSLGGVIVLLVWLYITSIMIVLGGEINGTLASMFIYDANQGQRKNIK